MDLLSNQYRMTLVEKLALPPKALPRPWTHTLLYTIKATTKPSTLSEIYADLNIRTNPAFVKKCVYIALHNKFISADNFLDSHARLTITQKGLDFVNSFEPLVVQIEQEVHTEYDSTEFDNEIEFSFYYG